ARAVRSVLMPVAFAVVLVQCTETTAWSGTTDPAVSDTRIEKSTNTLVVQGRHLAGLTGTGLSAVSLTVGATIVPLSIDFVSASEIDATLPDSSPASKLAAGQYAVQLTYGRQQISTTVDYGRTF